MYELPEAMVVAKQVGTTLKGKTIVTVIINQHPHKFAFFNRPLADYERLLRGKTVIDGLCHASRIAIRFAEVDLLVWDGARLKYSERPEDVPDKHQLLLRFADESTLSVSVQMYGGIELWESGDPENIYMRMARIKPNPLTDAFTPAHFHSLFDEQSGKLSLKAFLATKQRIPGLGNGILQDILLVAGMHPKRKANTLRESEVTRLYAAIVTTIKAMATSGGRDGETDLFGQAGTYRTLAKRHARSQPCPQCGGALVKEAYLGGAIYYCENCQK